MAFLKQFPEKQVSGTILSAQEHSQPLELLPQNRH